MTWHARRDATYTKKRRKTQNNPWLLHFEQENERCSFVLWHFLYERMWREYCCCFFFCSLHVVTLIIFPLYFLFFGILLLHGQGKKLACSPGYRNRLVRKYERLTQHMVVDYSTSVWGGVREEESSGHFGCILQRCTWHLVSSGNSFKQQSFFAYYSIPSKFSVLFFATWLNFTL